VGRTNIRITATATITATAITRRMATAMSAGIAITGMTTGDLTGTMHTIRARASLIPMLMSSPSCSAMTG